MWCVGVLVVWCVWVGIGFFVFGLWALCGVYVRVVCVGGCVGVCVCVCVCVFVCVCVHVCVCACAYVYSTCMLRVYFLSACMKRVHWVLFTDNQCHATDYCCIGIQVLSQLYVNIYSSI